MSPLAMAVQSWRDQARCTTEDSRLFFTEHQGERPDKAKAICRRCPVTTECLEHALSQREYHGVWGGTSENERREMIRRRNAGTA